MRKKSIVTSMQNWHIIEEADKTNKKFAWQSKTGKKSCDFLLFTRTSRWLVHVREYPASNTHASNHCTNLPFKMASFLQLLCILVVFFSFSFANKVEDEETCRTYAGGQVYPERSKTPEHAMHWSKARSKFYTRADRSIFGQRHNTKNNCELPTIEIYFQDNFNSVVWNWG